MSAPPLGTSEYSSAPTCSTGFWRPGHRGCPVCGPGGPCRSPEYEALIQASAAASRRRRVLLALTAVAVAATLVLLAACAHRACPVDDTGGYERCVAATGGQV